MRGVVMYAPGDVRVEERADPQILTPTDAVLRLAGDLCLRVGSVALPGSRPSRRTVADGP